MVETSFLSKDYVLISSESMLNYISSNGVAPKILAIANMPENVPTSNIFNTVVDDAVDPITHDKTINDLMLGRRKALEYYFRKLPRQPHEDFKGRNVSMTLRPLPVGISEC